MHSYCTWLWLLMQTRLALMRLIRKEKFQHCDKQHNAMQDRHICRKIYYAITTIIAPCYTKNQVMECHKVEFTGLKNVLGFQCIPKWWDLCWILSCNWRCIVVNWRWYMTVEQSLTYCIIATTRPLSTSSILRSVSGVQLKYVLYIFNSHKYDTNIYTMRQKKLHRFIFAIRLSNQAIL